MLKIMKYGDMPKTLRDEVKDFSDSCIANEMMMNTGELCWFISDKFYKRFKNTEFVVDFNKRDGLRASAMLQRTNRSKEVTLAYFYVKRKYRNQGIGTKMLKKAVTAAAERGVKLSLKVNPRNYVAFKLYGKMGFVPEADQVVVMSISPRKHAQKENTKS